METRYLPIEQRLRAERRRGTAIVFFVTFVAIAARLLAF